MPAVYLNHPFYCPSSDWWGGTYNGRYVEYKRIGDTEEDLAFDGEYDYICECGQEEGVCLHVGKAAGDHCCWIQYFEGDKPLIRKGEILCPQCEEKILVNLKSFSSSDLTKAEAMVESVAVEGSDRDELLKHAIYKIMYGNVKGLSL